MKYVLSVLFFVSISVEAAEVWHTAKIRSVYPLGNGSVVITFVSDSSACTNTNTPAKYYLLTPGVNGVNEQGAKNMYSAVLAAAASGKDLTINFESTDTNCSINRLSVAF